MKFLLLAALSFVSFSSLGLATMPLPQEPATASSIAPEDEDGDDEEDTTAPECVCPASDLPRVSNTTNCGISLSWVEFSAAKDGVCKDGECPDSKAKPCRWDGKLVAKNITNITAPPGVKLRITFNPGSFGDVKPGETIANPMSPEAACNDSDWGIIDIKNTVTLNNCQALFWFDCGQCTAASDG